MSYVAPTVSEFKSFFTRDFPYGNDPQNAILDSDISRAISETDIVINEGLFPSQSSFSLGFKYLTAHNLAMNIRESSQGLASQFEWGISSKGVGSVSVGVTIPPDIANNPQFAYYTKTSYGAKYLMMVLPLLYGTVLSVQGGTQA